MRTIEKRKEKDRERKAQRLLQKKERSRDQDGDLQDLAGSEDNQKSCIIRWEKS